MFKCENCGEVFERPQSVMETHGLDCPPYEEIFVCQNCGSPNFFEAFPCIDCGEYFLTSEIVGNGICIECLKAELDFKDLIEYGEEITESDEINDFVQFILNGTGDETIKEIIDKYITENAEDIGNWWCENNEP